MSLIRIWTNLGGRSSPGFPHLLLDVLEEKVKENINKETKTTNSNQEVGEFSLPQSSLYISL